MTKFTAAATRNNTTPTKNTRRPSRSRSISARTHAQSHYKDPGATYDDIHKAVIALVVTARNAQRVLGTSHPTTTGIERSLRLARTALHRARDLENVRGAHACAEKVLRFPVGTRVECEVFGGWHKGVVVKHRYRKASMSYEIRLDRSCRIVVPHDDDRSIRRAID